MQHLARRGAKVYLAARSEARARDAIARLTEAGLAPGNGELAWHELDLSDPRKVKKSAEDFAAKEKRLDVLGAPCSYCRHSVRETESPSAQLTTPPCKLVHLSVVG